MMTYFLLHHTTELQIWQVYSFALGEKEGRDG